MRALICVAFGVCMSCGGVPYTPVAVCSEEDPGLEGALAAAVQYLSRRDGERLPDALVTQRTECRVRCRDREIALLPGAERFVLSACWLQGSNVDRCERLELIHGKPGGAPRRYDFSDDIDPRPLEGFEGPQAQVLLGGPQQMTILYMGFASRWRVLTEGAGWTT